MGQKLSEIIKDLLSRKNPDGSRQWTQMTLAATLGTNQSGISQMLTGRQWDDHFEVFRKLIVDVEPQALFGAPLDADTMWHYLYLLVHTKVPHEIRSPAWGRIREKIEKIIEDEAKGIDDPTPKAAKPTRIGKAKTRS
jgi:hypothetical protein